MRKEFETIAQYKEQMRALLDKAEAEKRALDASEKEQFEQLKTKKELDAYLTLFLTSLIIALWKNTTE